MAENQVMDLKQKLELFTLLDKAARKAKPSANWSTPPPVTSASSLGVSGSRPSSEDESRISAVRSLADLKSFYYAGGNTADPFWAEWKKLKEPGGAIEIAAKFLQEYAAKVAELTPKFAVSVKGVRDAEGHITQLASLQSRASVLSTEFTMYVNELNRWNGDTGKKKQMLGDRGLVTSVSNFTSELNRVNAVLGDSPMTYSIPPSVDQYGSHITNMSSVITSLQHRVQANKARHQEELQKYDDGKRLSTYITSSGTRLFDEFLNIPYIYTKFGPHLVESVDNTKKLLAAYVSEREMDDKEDPNPALLSQAKAAVQTLTGISTKLMLSINEPTRLPELDDAVERTLNNIALSVAVSKFKPSGDMSAPSGLRNKKLWSTANRMTSPAAAAAAGPPQSGFLFRSVDPVRVLRYLDQIRRFRDAVSKSNVVDQVAQHSKRIMQVNEELIKAAKGYAASLNPPVGTPDAAATKNILEASVRTRQLAKRKAALIETYIRSVRAAAGTFAGEMIRFVQYKHGDAIRYMSYWGGVSDDMIPSPELREAIKQHNAMTVEVGEMGRDKIMGHVMHPAIESVNAVLNDRGSDASVLTLENSVVLDLEGKRDRMGAWMEAQADRVHTSFLRGAPTLLDDMFEPQQLVIWALKALRIGIAAVVLDVAARAYRGVYQRRVHVLDQPPPDPAVFVAMFLALDATFHLLVLAVLFTLFKMLKTPDNSFPIDLDVISRWAMDYVAGTVVVMLLCLALGYIIKNKRYFRFRHEGDRAIRSLAKMSFYVYVVTVPIPFYRLTQG
jgi:hypothetical protein